MYAITASRTGIRTLGSTTGESSPISLTGDLASCTCVVRAVIRDVMAGDLMPAEKRGFLRGGVVGRGRCGLILGGWLGGWRWGHY